MKSDIELYLDHLDRLTGCEASFTQITPPDVQPPIHVALYQGFPTADSYSAFTVGLSLVPPADQPDARHELLLVMRSSDRTWALAMGELALQLRGQASFAPNQHFGFGTPMSDESPMSSFFTHFPHSISAADACVALDTSRIHIVQLYPIFESERAFLRDHDSSAFVSRIDPSLLHDPHRETILNA